MKAFRMPVKTEGIGAGNSTFASRARSERLKLRPAWAGSRAPRGEKTADASGSSAAIRHPDTAMAEGGGVRNGDTQPAPAAHSRAARASTIAENPAAGAGQRRVAQGFSRST